jgi:hypothetical protein
MSIAILTQVYDEMRRLAIAGSVVSGGDFRLKKLIPPLEQAGAKAPVFAKVAEAVKAVVESTEQTSAPALLELITLVNAILYTQGETGIAGTAEPIQTRDLGTATAQASARVLKPLLDALTTTGPGRLELIRVAYERGAFRDLRLVKPALEALDDGYSEISDFIAQKVLPLYGKAILHELRAKFDPKGRAGHPRRLQLMHALDPAGARDLVKQALESGSKEVKIVAIACLGADADDLSYLLEQASAKAQDVRLAAYQALATVDKDEAVAVLQKAMNGPDLQLALEPLTECKNAKVLASLHAAVEHELAAVCKTKDRKEITGRISRLNGLLYCLQNRADANTETLLLKAFAQRADLAKIRGAGLSGSDLNANIVRAMSQGTRKLQTVLVDAHALLSWDELSWCFQAARRALPVAKVYATFSGYLTAKVDEKKKQRDPAWARREAIIGALNQRFYHADEPTPEDDLAELDPRWLDLAVQLQHLNLVRRLMRPGHNAAHDFLHTTFQETFKKAKQLADCYAVVEAMIAAEHPEAADAFVAVLERFGKRVDYYAYGWAQLIPSLPRSALGKLEAMIPKLNEQVADSLLGYIQQLREKP